MNENASTKSATASENGVHDRVPTDEEIFAETRPDRVLELHREYTAKLDQWTKEARAISDEWKKDNAIVAERDNAIILTDQISLSYQLRTRIQRTRPAIVDMIRYTSGLIENTRLRPITKLELRLRAAECEAALETLDSALMDLPV